MPDIHKNTINHSKYRYTIPELLSLSSKACLLFDLSKFSYDAARAGVVPPLGDCAITSRKSSTTCSRNNRMEGINAEELANALQENTRTGPRREPYLPPPVDRQKDEGFARFLKKHSSPTHNRVTAGGRIVPMEPRSPPTFALPPSIKDHSQPVSGSHDFLTAQTDKSREQTSKSQKSFDRQTPTGLPAFSSPPSTSTAYQGHPEMNANLMPTTYPASIYNTPLSGTIAFTNSASPMPPGLLGSYGPMQEVTAGMPPASYDPHFGFGGYIQYVSPTMPLGVPLPTQNAEVSNWDLYGQPFGESFADFPTLSTQQQLAAWQQHFTDLDLQLKNIDRHRAMHQLDPHLAEQRRVIVQQRSDAKDTIQEYQSMLGLKRMTDSSQDSFTTGFNIDAPAYVPVKDPKRSGPYPRQDAVNSLPGKEYMFKPQGPSGCRAIPIIPPPSQIEEAKGGGSTKDWNKRKAKASAQVQQWKEQSQDVACDREVEPTTSTPELEVESGSDQQRNSEQFPSSQTSQMAQMKPSPDSEPFRSLEESLSLNASSSPLAQATDNPSSTPARSEQELHEILLAIMQPRGVSTSVRLSDGTAVDVEGQGLQLSTFLSTYKPQSNQPEFNSSVEKSMMPDVRHTTPPNDQVFDLTSIDEETDNKENIAVIPLYHQKAATDAFLSQFNMIDDNMALALKSETQSLRAVLNRHQKTDSLGYKTQDVYRSGINFGLQSGQRQPLGSYNQKASEASQSDHDVFIAVGDLSTDEFSNKGYSSVSIQNVHAIARLPQNLDGSYENQQNAQTRLSNVNKARSPRLLRRYGANGGA